MEFSKILNVFTISAIVVLLLVAFICACVTVVERANNNLEYAEIIESKKSCTQINARNC